MPEDSEDEAEDPQQPNEEDAGEGSQQEQEEEEAESPNLDKFIPDVVHLHRSQLFDPEEPTQLFSSMQEIITYTQQLKQSERIELIVEDCQLESMQTDVVDWAFANQVGYLNL